LFFDEEVFGYIEPIIERQVAAYDHYAFTEIEKERWFAIADDLEKLASALTSAESVSDLNDNVGFVFKGTDERFAATFDENKTALVQLFTKFSAWVRAQVNQYGSTRTAQQLSGWVSCALRAPATGYLHVRVVHERRRATVQWVCWWPVSRLHNRHTRLLRLATN
jgi:hypothetical protein